MADFNQGHGSPVIAALDLGGTRFRVALVTAEGQILHRVSEPTRSHEGLDAVLHRIYQTIRLVHTQKGMHELAGIAVAAPGPLDPATGILHSPPNMQGWYDVPLKDLIEQEFRIPVVIGNDANVAALGEHRFGSGRGVSDMVYFTVSTGIGGGIIANNRLLAGARGLAGEVGHMTIVPDGPLCGCGNRGCLEAMSSGTSIGRRARELVAAGAQSSMLDLAGGDPARITAEVVEQAARAGDSVGNVVMREAAEYLGIGVANVVSVLNPEMVVIGGGVSRVGALLFQPVWEVVTQRTMLSLRVNLRIVAAELGDDAGLIGCAALAQSFFGDSV